MMATIYTVGHSNHEPERFVALLRQHGIEQIVDVRSSPYSRCLLYTSPSPRDS